MPQSWQYTVSHITVALEVAQTMERRDQSGYSAAGGRSLFWEMSDCQGRTAMRMLSHFLHAFCRYLGGLGALSIAALVAGGVFIPAAANAQDYEIWALDQGTNIVHIYNAKLEEVGRIDMGAHQVLACRT